MAPPSRASTEPDVELSVVLVVDDFEAAGGTLRALREQGDPGRFELVVAALAGARVDLAALRSAMLWRQLGGSWFDLLLSRRRMVETARELLAEGG